MFIGHKSQWEFLQKITKENRIPHGYLFCGPSKIGKRTMALKWISGLLCQDLEKNPIHPDLFLIESEEKDSLKREIQIRQIKDLIWKLSLKPSLASLKVAIINDAHLMNQEAQTCLLKTLEEPRGQSLIILISEFPQMLLPTIRSRVEKLIFSSLNANEMENFLAGDKRATEKPERLIEISQGKPGLLLDLMSSKEKFERAEKRIDEALRINKVPLFKRFQYVKDLSENPKEATEVLLVWLDFFRNALIFSLFSERKEELGYSREKLRKILSNIQKTILLLSNTNINTKLALENLVMDL